MSQNQGGQGGRAAAPNRPAILEQISTTTFDDLEQQFAEGDRAEWDRFTQSFGWSQADSDAVWAWFGQRATPDQQSSSLESWPEGPGLGGH